MGIKIAKPTGPAAYFNASEHMADLAVALEPKSIAKDQEHTYRGKTKLRDEVVADVTAFGTSEALETGTPTKVLKGVKITAKYLCKELEPNIGSVFLGVIRKVPMGEGNAYVFRSVSDGVEAQVIDYLEKREQAVAEALANVPSFD